MIFNATVQLTDRLAYVGFSRSGSYSVLSLQVKGRCLSSDSCCFIVPVPGLIVDAFTAEGYSNFITNGISQLTNRSIKADMADCDIHLVKELDNDINDNLQNGMKPFNEGTSKIIKNIYSQWDLLIVKIVNFASTKITKPIIIIYDSVDFRDKKGASRIYIPNLSNKTDDTHGIYTDISPSMNGPVANSTTITILCGCDDTIMSTNKCDKINFKQLIDTRVIDNNCGLCHINDRFSMNGDIFILKDDISRYGYSAAHLFKPFDTLASNRIL